MQKAIKNQKQDYVYPAIVDWGSMMLMNLGHLVRAQSSRDCLQTKQLYTLLRKLWLITAHTQVNGVYGRMGLETAFILA